MKLYLESGYLNVPGILGCGMPYTIIDGGRGIGKSYGILEDVTITNPRLFIYLRRTQNELDVIYSDESLNPFNGLNQNTGKNIGLIKKSKHTGIICDREIDDEGCMKQKGPAMGLSMALSGLANMRGFDGTPYETLFYDEFIPESHVRLVKNEFDALMNAIETVGRNRELQGHPPLQVILAANANRLDNPVFMGLKLVTQIERMRRKGQEISIQPHRGLVIVDCQHSPISEAKSRTALYNLTADTEFYGMAINNEFVGEFDKPYIRSRPLNEYICMAAVGELAIYRHKSDIRFYICTKKSGTPSSYGTSATELNRLKRDYRFLCSAYIDGLIDFPDKACELLFLRYMDFEP